MNMDIAEQIITTLHARIDELVAERDALAANHKECVRCLGEALQDTSNLAVERDKLAAEVARPESTAFTIFRAEYASLRNAARLALDALEDSESYVGCPSWSPSMLLEVQQTITALRQAGVQ